MSWLILLTFLFGLYLLFLAGYRLLQSGKNFAQAARRTNELLAELNSYERVEPQPARAVSSADFQQTLVARRRLVRQRVRRQEDRQRRLVARIREIDVDKRWS